MMSLRMKGKTWQCVCLKAMIRKTKWQKKKSLMLVPNSFRSSIIQDWPSFDLYPPAPEVRRETQRSGRFRRELAAQWSHCLYPQWWGCMGWVATWASVPNQSWARTSPGIPSRSAVATWRPMECSELLCQGNVQWVASWEMPQTTQSLGSHKRVSVWVSAKEGTLTVRTEL